MGLVYIKVLYQTHTLAAGNPQVCLFLDKRSDLLKIALWASTFFRHITGRHDMKRELKKTHVGIRKMKLTQLERTTEKAFKNALINHFGNSNQLINVKNRLAEFKSLRLCTHLI